MKLELYKTSHSIGYYYDVPLIVRYFKYWEHNNLRNELTKEYYI